VCYEYRQRRNVEVSGVGVISARVLWIFDANY
jgi:hypothetical protein